MVFLSTERNLLPSVNIKRKLKFVKNKSTQLHVSSDKKKNKFIVMILKIVFACLENFLLLESTILRM